MLLHPNQFGPTNKINGIAQNLIDPRCSRRGSVIGIVLNVETNQGLRNPVENGQRKTGARGHPAILQIEKQGHVTDTTAPPSRRSVVPTGRNEFVHFPFDLAFKFGIKSVLALIVGNAADALQLFQPTAPVVIGMDHLVIDRRVVATKQVNGVAAGMRKARQIVDDAIDANFARPERVQGSFGEW